jgi:hypothetical protein
MHGSNAPAARLRELDPASFVCAIDPHVSLKRIGQPSLDRR